MVFVFLTCYSSEVTGENCFATWRSRELSIANKTENYNLIVLGWKPALEGECGKPIWRERDEKGLGGSGEDCTGSGPGCPEHVTALGSSTERLKISGSGGGGVTEAHCRQNPWLEQGLLWVILTGFTSHPVGTGYVCDDWICVC